MVKRLSIYLGVQVAYLVFIIVLGAYAMAKPSGIIPAPSQTAPLDPEEEFWNSEEGRLVEQLYDEVTSGKTSMEAARKRLDKFTGKKPASDIPRQVPNAPVSPHSPRR
jgi:hypothetical protein